MVAHRVRPSNRRGSRDRGADCPICRTMARRARRFGAPCQHRPVRWNVWKPTLCTIISSDFPTITPALTGASQYCFATFDNAPDCACDFDTFRLERQSPGTCATSHRGDPQGSLLHLSIGGRGSKCKHWPNSKQRSGTLRMASARTRAETAGLHSIKFQYSAEPEHLFARHVFISGLHNNA